jgi:hypothetical protein
VKDAKPGTHASINAPKSKRSGFGVAELEFGGGIHVLQGGRRGSVGRSLAAQP